MRFIRSLIIGAVILFALVAISNTFLKSPELSLNDLHIMWIVSGKNFFISPNDHVKLSHAKMIKNEELQKLDVGCDFFIKDKKANAFRIFCIGGSTTRGWPFNPKLSYPLLLSLYLKDLLPERTIEVINAGICGSDSSSDIALFKEIITYRPDIILVYEGRNEELDLPLHLGYKSWMVKMHVWLLRHVYFYSFLNNKLLSANNSQFNHGQNVRRFVEQKFKGNDYLLRNLLERNLKQMLILVRNKGCQVVLLTQVLSRDEMDSDSTVSKINDWIKQLALSHQAVFIDIDSVFRNSRTPYERLVIPLSVHPDLEGYFLMAKTICRAFSEKNIIAPKEKWQWDNLKIDSQYLKEINVTDDFLSSVYIERLGDFFKNTLNNAELAEFYYRRGTHYLDNRRAPHSDASSHAN